MDITIHYLEKYFFTENYRVLPRKRHIYVRGNGWKCEPGLNDGSSCKDRDQQNVQVYREVELRNRQVENRITRKNRIVKSRDRKSDHVIKKSFTIEAQNLSSTNVYISMLTIEIYK